MLGAIERTPAVWLERLEAARGLDGRVPALLDHLNPGGSKEDRAARGTVEAARARSARTRPAGGRADLGRHGTGLAIVCAVLGHPFAAVTSRGAGHERGRMMAALGAEVVLVDEVLGGRPGRVSGADLARVEDAAQRVAAERGAFRADQFHHPGDRAAHEATTGPEIWQASTPSWTSRARASPSRRS